MPVDTPLLHIGGKQVKVLNIVSFVVMLIWWCMGDPGTTRSWYGIITWGLFVASAYLVRWIFEEKRAGKANEKECVQCVATVVSFFSLPLLFKWWLGGRFILSRVGSGLFYLRRDRGNRHWPFGCACFLWKMIVQSQGLNFNEKGK